MRIFAKEITTKTIKIMTTIEKTYLSTKETSEELGVTKMTISRMVKRGELIPINHHVDYFLFKTCDILSIKGSIKKRKKDFMQL
jgi:IS30 family transposase